MGSERVFQNPNPTWKINLVEFHRVLKVEFSAVSQDGDQGNVIDEALHAWGGGPLLPVPCSFQNFPSAP